MTVTQTNRDVQEEFLGVAKEMLECGLVHGTAGAVFVSTTMLYLDGSPKKWITFLSPVISVCIPPGPLSMNYSTH